MRFALNHIAAPRLDLPAFLALARDLGVTEIEIRNDTPDLLATMRPGDVRRAAADAGVTILAVNALAPFNVGSGDLPARAQRMADDAAACGAQALVMCPRNDGTPVAHTATVAALDAIRPILAGAGLKGYVEPLGFPTSSLRTKSEAITAITEAGGPDVLAILHDTFHHALSGEAEVYPNRTALVHVSGVSDATTPLERLDDSHRIVLDPADRLGNRAQLARLRDGGYDGPVSFEPFAPEVHADPDPARLLRAAMAALA